MGKSTISMAIFNSFLYLYQRVFRSKSSRMVKDGSCLQSWRFQGLQHILFTGGVHICDTWARPKAEKTGIKCQIWWIMKDVWNMDTIWTNDDFYVTSYLPYGPYWAKIERWLPRGMIQRSSSHPLSGSPAIFSWKNQSRFRFLSSAAVQLETGSTGNWSWAKFRRSSTPLVCARPGVQLKIE